jgi:hypothetical protein
LLVGAGRQEVAGELFADELVERLVLIERLHDVVPIPPGVFVRKIYFESIRIGVARYIQPVAPPTLAIVR